MGKRLRLDWVDHKAALYACTHWHYSRSVPAGKTVKVGVWEDGVFTGVVIFSRGANNHLASPYGLDQTECVELTRIALDRHETPVSRVMAIAIRMLRKQSPGLRLLVSYADPAQGHVGGVYQANGWIFTGQKESTTSYLYKGEWVHGRTAGKALGSVKGLKTRTDEGKFCYIMPLDEQTRKKVAHLARPFPKRPKGFSGDPTPGGRFDSDPDAPALDHGQAQQEDAGESRAHPNAAQGRSDQEKRVRER